MRPRSFFFTILLVIFTQKINIAQTETDILKLCDDMCKQMNSSQESHPETIVSTVFEVNVMAFIIQHEITVVDHLLDKIHFNLYKNCSFYQDFIISVAPESEKKGDWNILNEIPTSSVTKKESRQLLRVKTIYYLESTGQKTYVKIKRGKWVETFHDGTQSHLKMKWIDENTFELEFIESNNRSRKGMSFKGDLYRYRLIECNSDHFIFVTLPRNDTARILQSKFYTP